MPDFSSPEEMVVDIQNRLVRATHGLGTEYAEIAELIAKDAKERLGSYHGAMPPDFPAWESLAESTMDERERLGYSRDEPELRDGTLRDHITPLPTEEAAIVAVPDEMVQEPHSKKPVNIAVVAEAQEHGDGHIPPRPFLGPALWAKREEALAIIRARVARSLEE